MIFCPDGSVTSASGAEEHPSTSSLVVGREFNKIFWWWSFILLLLSSECSSDGERTRYIPTVCSLFQQTSSYYPQCISLRVPGENYSYLDTALSLDLPPGGGFRRGRRVGLNVVHIWNNMTEFRGTFLLLCRGLCLNTTRSFVHMWTSAWESANHNTVKTNDRFASVTAARVRSASLDILLSTTHCVCVCVCRHEYKWVCM